MNGMDIVFVLLALFLATIYLKLFHFNLGRRFVKKIGGHPGMPILGNTFTFTNPLDYVHVFTSWMEKYGGRAAFSFGPLNFVCLFDPVDVEKVLMSTTLINKSFIYRYMAFAAGYGLPFSSGPKWRKHRKLVTPAFHFNILERFHPIFYEQVQVMEGIVREHIAEGKPADVHSMFTRCALDVIMETAMGKKLNCQRDLSQPYAHAFMRASDYVCQRMLRPWLFPDFMYRFSALWRKEKPNREMLLGFINGVINERRDLIKAERARKALEKREKEDDDDTFSSPRKKFAFLDLLINLQLDGEVVLSDLDVLEETISFMIAGHDTTAASLTWTLYLLSTHPEEQEKVQAELDEVFRDDPKRPITSADLPKLKYLECCLKESLRLYPSAPVMARSTHQDFKLDEDTIIPPGVDVLMVPWATHRNKKYYPDPEEYRPSRHFPENALKRPPCAFIPFSAGPRNCVGQRFALAEEKIVMAHLLRNFRARCINPDSVHVRFEIFARPDKVLLFEFEPRN